MIRFLTLCSGLALLAAGLNLQAQTRVEVSHRRADTAPAAVRYHYLFENERFTTPREELEFGADGRGKYRFTRKDRGEVVNDLAVSPELAARVGALFSELRFLESSEDYQHKKDFSHLGKITVGEARDGRERAATFNYTDNEIMTRLVEIFRNIATQEWRVFDLENVRATDPISTPAQLRLLESELKSKRIAEPRRLVPLLQELRTDESVPLIARNHAERLIKTIDKEK
ncbi:MAG TPA: hypothetical protein VFC61_04430 [Blastocatellia bacterium]|nr:hypothetical protein [Blastocatellia bacterium]